MAKRQDKEDWDPNLCTACKKDVMFHCQRCGQCRCTKGAACKG